MSSPVTIPRTFINMSASSPIDLTIPPLPVRRTPVTADIIIISESEDENNDSSHRNNSNYHFNDNTNSILGFDSQSIFNSSTRHSSNNIQDSSGNNTSYNLRSGLTGLGTNGSSSNRGTSTRPSRRPNFRGFLDFMLTTVNQANNNNNHRHRHHPSAFHPYASTAEVLLTANDIRYGNNNSSGSSRSPMTTFFDSNRANTTNDVQILNTPPRRRTNNSPKPPILSGHARDLDDSHTLICADCNELLHEKLWALSNCGHVVCGSCVDKYKYSEKKKIPCPSCKKTVNPKNILPLYV